MTAAAVVAVALAVGFVAGSLYEGVRKGGSVDLAARLGRRESLDSEYQDLCRALGDGGSS